MQTLTLVDNDLADRKPAEAALRSAGYDVLTADDGVEGLALIREKRPSAAVVELLLPKLHGFAVCQEIRNAPELRRTTKVVVTSSKSYPTDIKKALELGAVDFLVKPFDPEKLVAAVDKACADLPVPANEVSRLVALQGCRVLDSPPESAFDNLTMLASLICDCPVALISLVDSDRQWFKSKVGTELQQTSRQVAFCAHAILQQGVFVVPDATKDARFNNNVLVTLYPGIRFYAGAPVLTPGGEALGTICVIDRVPRQLSPAQLECLKLLARLVESQLALRRALAEANERVNRLTGADTAA